jgi:hypothetical protein
MVLDLIPYSKCNWDGSRLSFLRHCLLIIYSLILRMIRCFMTLIGIGYRFCASLSPYLTEMIVLPFYAPRSSYMYCMLLVPINLVSELTARKYHIFEYQIFFLDLL